MNRKPPGNGDKAPQPDTISVEEAAITLGLHREGGTWRGMCPSCRRGDSFTLGPGRIRNIVYNCFAGCDARELTRALRENGVMTLQVVANTTQRPRTSFSDMDPDEADAYRKEQLRIEAEKAEPNPAVVALLDRCRPARGTIVETYLRSRGITLPVPETLMFCGDYMGAPAMVAAGHIVGYGVPVMASVTFLRADGTGKADRAMPRMCVGKWKHGPHIPLIDNGKGPLGISEGIETALAAIQLGVIRSAWTGYCADNIKKIVLPIRREIWFLMEHDRNGASARSIREAKTRLEKAGQKVRVVSPIDRAFGDFNDQLMNKRRSDHDAPKETIPPRR